MINQKLFLECIYYKSNAPGSVEKTYKNNGF